MAYNLNPFIASFLSFVCRAWVLGIPKVEIMLAKANKYSYLCQGKPLDCLY